MEITKKFEKQLIKTFSELKKLQDLFDSENNIKNTSKVNKKIGRPKKKK